MASRLRTLPVKTSNRKRIYEHYAGMFPTFEMFCQVMDQCTENYECLVVNNNSKSNRLQDQVFWYKAEPHETFRIGSDNFWLFSDENYKDTQETDYNVHKNRYNVIKK